MTTTEAKRRDRAALEAELRAAGATIKGAAVRCPFHDDRHPSGSIYADGDGIWRFKCNAASCGFGGDLYDVRARATGRDIKDILRDENPRSASPRSESRERVFATLDEVRAAISTAGHIEAEYGYDNPHVPNRPDMIVFRLRTPEGKSFRQASPAPYKPGWVLRAPKKPWPLYNRSAILDAKDAIVVEGEKCVEALKSIGIAAVTTSPCGAGKGRHADWRILAGKRVFLWPDADDVGRQHMKEVMQIIETLDPAPEIHLIEPTDLDLIDHEDAADLIAMCHKTGEDVVAVIDRACALSKTFSISSGLRERIEDTISGKWSDVAWPWPKLTRLSRALLPQTVTILCGTPGAAKSFFLFKSLIAWQEAGIPWACLALEEDRVYHLHRVMAIRERNVDLLDPEFQKSNPDIVRAAYERQRLFLDAFGKRLWDAPVEPLSLDMVTSWVRDRAREGNRIVAVDPVTAAAASEKAWVADAKFITAVKSIVRSRDCSLILVTHPKKGARMIGLDDLAGGASYQRLSQSILWLERLQTTENAVILGPLGRFETPIKHKLHLCKTRNGRGHGLSLAFEIDWPTLSFQEYGVIADE
ncbi:MAG: AAA family ATPase [Sedimentisphaerales bacterium]|jgi:hypothetical protein|nr:AAA family ATPase [Sedimentisphaerales bacterium]NLT75660.1 AAA family ATPase [Planctomycetota bacterium]